MEASTRLSVRSDLPKEISIVPAIAAMALSIGIGLLWFLLSGNTFDPYPYSFILPWLMGLAIVLCIPSVILYRKGRFTFANPIVFATWSYFFPAFVLGGLVFAFGFSQPEFLSYIQDVRYTLPLTIVLVALGFGALSVGYFLPVGEKIGSAIAKRLSSKSYPAPSYIAPGVLLLILGALNTIIAFTLGLFGFQRSIEFSQYDGLIYTTTLFWLQGGFLLWYLLFRQKKLSISTVPIFLLLISTSIASMVFAGNRGTVIQVFTMIALAFVLSGREFRVKQLIAIGSMFSIVLILSMIYGSTFRSVKGTESVQGVEQYTENVLATFGELERNDLGQTLEYGFTSLAQRIDIVTTLAVVVSNHEALKPYEEAYGLDNNIWVDTTTFLIPRALWKDKPAASDARKYSDLYFNYGENSFAITPIGDLLRNFGIIGVPIGMLTLGIVLRITYRALVERQTAVVWRVVLFFMIISSVSYEGFFGTIIPNMFKVGFVSLIGILIFTFFAGVTARMISNSRRGHRSLAI